MLSGEATNTNFTIFGLTRFDLIDFWCFNATFSNISAISWRATSFSSGRSPKKVSAQVDQFRQVSQY
jgi:hypothetical protein